MIGCFSKRHQSLVAGYDNFVILNHHEEPHGFFLDLLDLGTAAAFCFSHVNRSARV